MAAALIEISFQGGHGTAAGLTGLFNDLGFEEGKELALGLATIGVISGIVCGNIFINYAVRSKKIKLVSELEDLDNNNRDQEIQSSETIQIKSSNSFSLQIGFIALSILLGVGFHKLISFISILKYIPIFPLAMIGGVIIQFILEKFNKENILNEDILKNISSFSLDFLIASTVATISLSIIKNNFEIFVILALSAILWNLFALIVLAPKIIPSKWVERGLSDFGQSMGMTVTGLLLVKMVDPENKSSVLESFSYKQLLFEPIVGGGIFTALSMPLINQLGANMMLFICSVLFISWLLLGIFYFGKIKDS